jgi:translation initiation factor 1
MGALTPLSSNARGVYAAVREAATTLVRSATLRAVKNSRPVYSTEHGRLSPPARRRETPPPSEPRVPDDGVVRIFRDRSGRQGKVVTVITGLPTKDLESRATLLKRLCGAGGAVKAGAVEIQGDHRERIADTLKQLGHSVKLAGG